MNYTTRASSAHQGVTFYADQSVAQGEAWVIGKEHAVVGDEDAETLTPHLLKAIESTSENCRLMRHGGCFVPEQHKHLKWHVLKIEYPTGIMWERAEWVNDPENGPTEGGHWVRWGKTGDFPSLCKADYFGPAVDQESPYIELPWDERFEAYSHAERD